MNGRWVRTTLAAMGVAAGLLALPGQASASGLNCEVGCSTVFAGAYWVTVNQSSTGTGVIDSFVRISAANTAAVDGHNTSGRPLLNNENSSPTFTRDLTLAEVPIVLKYDAAAGVFGFYYEFLLDINQQGSAPLLALNNVQICLATVGGLRTADTCPTGVGGTLAYQMGTFGATGVDPDYIRMNYNLNSGSGSGDLFMYIPVATLGLDLTKYVYLFSQFGAVTNYNGNNYGNNDGFEEWAVRICGEADADGFVLECFEPPLPNIPEPASMVLLGTGLFALAVVSRRPPRARA